MGSGRGAPRPDAGFTLIEIFVVTALFTALMAAMLASLLVGRSSYASADAYIQVQQEARRAFDSMVRELREGGNVNGSASIAAPGVQRLDLQISRGYDATACGGICWGTESATFPNGWIHYVLDTSDPQRPRFMRCVTANRLDPMPAQFVGCRVLANSVSSGLASTAFTYDHANRMVTIKLQASVTSKQLPGGSMQAAPTPLTTRVRLRNT